MNPDDLKGTNTHSLQNQRLAGPTWANQPSTGLRNHSATKKTSDDRLFSVPWGPLFRSGILRWKIDMQATIMIFFCAESASPVRYSSTTSKQVRPSNLLYYTVWWLCPWCNSKTWLWDVNRSERWQDIHKQLSIWHLCRCRRWQRQTLALGVFKRFGTYLPQEGTIHVHNQKSQNVVRTLLTHPRTGKYSIVPLQIG
jgi:hypothetical protein